MTIRKVRVWWVIVLFAFSLGSGVLWFASRQPLSDANPETTTVRIGVICSANQSQPSFMFLADVARDEINGYCEEIGSGFRFKFVYNCSDVSAEKAIEITRWYAENDIRLVIGYEWSSHLHASMRDILAEDMAVISISANYYGWAGIWPNLFRLCPHEFKQIEPLVQMMTDLGVTDVVIIYRNDYWERFFINGFTHGNLTGFIEEYEAQGGNVTHAISYPHQFWTMGPDGYMIMWEKYLEKAESSIKGVNERAGGAAVLLVDYPGGAEYLLMKAVEYPSLMNVTWFTTESLYTRGILSFAGEIAAQLKLLHLSLTFEKTAIYDRINEACREEFNLPLGFYSANIYDACWLMALSVIEADTVNSTAIIKTLPEVASAYEGATGSCAIDESYYRARAEYDVYGFFKVDGETQRLKCGFYNATTDEITWDKELIPYPRGEGG